MLRLLMLTIVHLFIMPPLAFTGGVVMLFRRSSEMVSRVARPWGGLALRATGAEVRVTGIERLMDARPAVVVMNHASAIDIYVACRYLPIPFRIVAKQSLFRIPVFGLALRVGGFVPLQRTGGLRDVHRIERIDWGTGKNAVVCFFPEGTRSRDGRLKAFKRGAFVTAIRERVPIVPVVLIGTHDVQPPGSFRPRPGCVEMRVLDPVSTVGLTEADRDRLRDEVHERIRRELEREAAAAAAAG